MKTFGSTIKYIVLTALISSACNRGMICPAFQSSFILDDSVRYAHFSHFGPDSLPKTYLTAKNRYGIIEEISDLQKQQTFKTVEMVTIFPPPVPIDSSMLMPEYQEDSLRFADPQLSSQVGK